jgi:hypothetical protein
MMKAQLEEDDDSAITPLKVKEDLDLNDGSTERQSPKKRRLVGRLSELDNDSLESLFKEKVELEAIIDAYGASASEEEQTTQSLFGLSQPDGSDFRTSLFSSTNSDSGSHAPTVLDEETYFDPQALH